MLYRRVVRVAVVAWALLLGIAIIRWGDHLRIPRVGAIFTVSVGSFFLLLLMYRPLELAYPANASQRFFRPQWWTDLLFFFGQYLLFNAIIFAVLHRAQGYIHAATPEAIRHAIGALPMWSQAILVIFLGDVITYWGHRMQHKVGFLWRFHVIHHSIEHLDWLAGYREHPLDTLYTSLLVGLPVFALGFSMQSLAWFVGFRGIWVVYAHANVRLPIGPLRILIGSPELHHWHHDRERDFGNYSPVSPLIDLIFGTYHCPDHEPAAVGVKEPVPDNYFGQMIHPFLPRIESTEDDALEKSLQAKKRRRQVVPHEVRRA